MKRFFRALGGLAALSFLAAVMACGGSGGHSPTTDVLSLETVKSLVKVTYASNDEDWYVTQDVTLSSSSINGVSVAWTSSNPSVITIDGSVGRVTRPKADTNVTLTATLKKGNETQTKTFKLSVIGTVSNELRGILYDAEPEKTVILASDPTLTLSATVTWESDHPKIIEIDANGTVTITLPTTKTAVVLTATAKKDGVTESLDFTITVYPAGSTPTAEDLLSSIPFTAKTINDRRRLPSEIAGAPGTQITWTSNKEESLSIEKDGGEIWAVPHRDLRDIPVQLTATLAYNGQIASKVFDVTVERITEATYRYGSNATYTFTDSTITFTATRQSQGKAHTDGIRWAYTLDPAQRRITAHQTHILSEDGRWIAIGSAEHKQQQMARLEAQITYGRKFMSALKTLSEKTSVTLRDLGQVFGFEPSESEESIYQAMQKRGCIPSEQKYEDFQKLSDAEKSAVIQEGVSSHKKGIIEHYGLSADADWAAILDAFNADAAQQKKSYENEFQAFVSEAKTPYVYTYSFDEDGAGSYSCTTQAVHDSTKKWFEQAGWYSDNSGSYEVAFNLYNLPNAGFRYNNQGYNGTLNGDGTEFKGKNSDGEEITCNITDKKDGTLSVAVAGTSETYTLAFSGYSLR
jgi:hypothetical protein